MRLVKVATRREVIQRDWCLEDPVLRDLPNLRMQEGTNYRLGQQHAARLDALWSRTGRDWTRNEAVAGLWAYAQTYGQSVSRLPGSSVANVALALGRAVSSVYAKVMNFRSLDPRATGAGMSGAGATDRTVWNEFYDGASSSIRTEQLNDEFRRLWDGLEPDAIARVEASAAAAIIADEADRLEELSREELLAKYQAQGNERRRPTTRTQSTRAYERNPLVIAIARLRASHRCEIANCAHPMFETSERVQYTEVHHIVPLAEGGEDAIENVACLCPAHHREVHLGIRSQELGAQLVSLRTRDN
jgi:predicted HNH restriction endonuclease